MAVQHRHKDSSSRFSKASIPLLFKTRRGCPVDVDEAFATKNTSALAHDACMAAFLRVLCAPHLLLFFMDFFLFPPAFVKIHAFFILYPAMFLLSSYIQVCSTAICCDICCNQCRGVGLVRWRCIGLGFLMPTRTSALSDPILAQVYILSLH